MRDLRYNRQVSWPEWADERIAEILPTINTKRLEWSPHYKRKRKAVSRRDLLRRYNNQIKKYLDSAPELKLDRVFEFYQRRKDLTIKKICHRDKLPGTDYDIILVIATEGILVTVYLNKSDYVHSNLDEELYIQGQDNDN